MDKIGSLKEVTQFKKEIVAKMLGTEKLMQLLCNTNESPFSLPVAAPGEALYRNIFPYVFAGPQTEEHIESYIMLEFICEGASETYVKMGVLAYFYTHKQLMLIKDENNETKVRRDAIMEEVFSVLRRENWGIGPLVFKSLQPAYGLGSSYLGSCMIFETRTFQSATGTVLNPLTPFAFDDDDDEWDDEP